MEETRHYFRVPYEITTEVKFKKMKYTSQSLYMVLCRLGNDMADKEGWFYRSIETLAEDTGLNRKTVIRAKQELLKENYIEVNRRYFKNNKNRASDYFKINGFTFRLGTV